jgi:hypothetical protein
MAAVRSLLAEGRLDEASILGADALTAVEVDDEGPGLHAVLHVLLAEVVCWTGSLRLLPRQSDDCVVASPSLAWVPSYVLLRRCCFVKGSFPWLTVTRSGRHCWPRTTHRAGSCALQLPRRKRQSPRPLNRGECWCRILEYILVHRPLGPPLPAPMPFAHPLCAVQVYSLHKLAAPLLCWLHCQPPCCCALTGS